MSDGSFKNVLCRIGNGYCLPKSVCFGQSVRLSGKFLTCLAKLCTPIFGSAITILSSNVVVWLDLFYYFWYRLVRVKAKHYRVYISVCLALFYPVRGCREDGSQGYFTFCYYEGEEAHNLRQREEELQQRQQVQAEVWDIMSLAYRTPFCCGFLLGFALHYYCVKTGTFH